MGQLLEEAPSPNQQPLDPRVWYELQSRNIRIQPTDTKMFFQLHQPPLLIDEVQYAPELFSITGTGWQTVPH